MIICVTPNVTVEHIYRVSAMQPGAVLSSQQSTIIAGGKGLNVARGIMTLGEKALAVGILGGRSGEMVAELVEREELATQWFWSKRETPHCVTIHSGDGTPTTSIDNEGALISYTEWLQFIQETTAIITGPDDVAEESGTTSGEETRARSLTENREQEPVSAVCICGNIPTGTTPKAPGDLVEGLLKTGKPVWVDVTGAALKQSLDAQPTGIKLNGTEAGKLLGRTLNYLDDVYEAASALHHQGIDYVIITLGARGAVLSSPNGELHLRPPITQANSGRGCGDAFLAGWLVAQAHHKSDRTALGWAVAAGSAHTLTPDGGPFARADFDDLLSQL